VILDHAGNNILISIPEVKDTITQSEIKTLMEFFVSKNIFESVGGGLAGLMEANIISRDVQEIAVR
jgi:hypothetical protein